MTSTPQESSPYLFLLILDPNILPFLLKSEPIIHFYRFISFLDTDNSNNINVFCACIVVGERGLLNNTKKETFNHVCSTFIRCMFNMDVISFEDSVSSTNCKIHVLIFLSIYECCFTTDSSEYATP